jgi:hypothetical protein
LNRAFDFEGDERWKKYVMNLEIPPGRDTSAVIERFKAKWYKREIVSVRTQPLCSTALDMHELLANRIQL